MMRPAPHLATPVRIPTNRTILKIVLIVLPALSPLLASGIGQPLFVDPVPRKDSFPLVNFGLAAAIHVDERDWPGVIRAASDLRSDITRVTGITPIVTHDEPRRGPYV